MSDPSETITTPQFKGTPYSVWSSQNVFEDPIESYSKYYDNLRLEYIAAGKYDENTEKSFQFNFRNILTEKELVNEENQEDVIAKLESPFKRNPVEEALFIRDAVTKEDGSINESVEDLMEFDEGELQQVVNYADALQTGGDIPEGIDVEKVDEIVREKKENYLKGLHRQNELSAGIYYTKEGQRRFIGGTLREGQTEADALKEGEKFGVKPTDVFSFRAYRKPLDATSKLKAFEVEQRQQVEQEVSVFLDKQDTLFSREIETYFHALARVYGSKKTWGVGDKTWDNVGEAANWFGRSVNYYWQNAFGNEDAKREVGKDLYYADIQEDFESDIEIAREELLAKLSEKTGLSVEKNGVLDDVINDMVIKLAAYGDGGNFKPTLNYSEDIEDMVQNVSKTKYSGAIVQEELNAKPELFRLALEKAGASAKEIEIADAKRQIQNETLFSSYSDTLMQDDKYSDNWQNALISGKQEGISNNEVLERFVKRYDPSTNWNGMWQSVGHGFSDVAFGVGNLLGYEWGKEGLLENAKNKAHLQQMRTIFGQDYTFGQKALEQVAPLIIDGVIAVGGALLTPFSAGGSALAAGGYFAAKQSATTTARVLLKGLFTSTLKAKAKKDASGKVITETSEEIAKRIQKAGTLKGLTEGQLVNAAKAYNKKLASVLDIKTPLFVSAATRSGSMNYAPIYTTVYDELERKHKDAEGEWTNGYSEERAKQEAHEAGYTGMLSAGAFTGILTVAFGSIGDFATRGTKLGTRLKALGGLENAYLKGMSFKGIKRVGDRLAGQVSSNETFAKMVKNLVSDTIKSAAGGGGLNLLLSAVGEAAEEGIDEFAQSLIQSAITGEEVSFRSRVEGALQGAAMGAFLGGASPAIGQVTRNVLPSVFEDKAAMLETEVAMTQRFVKEATATPELAADFEKLKEVAPQVASEFERIINENTPSGSDDTAREEEEDEEAPATDPVKLEEEARALEDKIAQGAASEERGSENATQQEEADAGKSSRVNPRVDASPAVNTVVEGDLNPSDAKQSVTSNIPSDRAPLTPDQEFKASVAEINRRFQLWKTKTKALKEMPSELSEQRDLLEKEIAQEVLRGDILDPNAHAVALRDAREYRSEQIKEANKPIELTEEDKETLKEFINKGFPVHLIADQLQQLGLDLSRTDTAYLNAATRYLKKQIREIYPTLKAQSGGVKLPRSLDPEGTVQLDEFGNGVFNNDPSGMATLLLNNISVELTQEQVESPAFNQAFRHEEKDGRYFLTDVMIPVRGGLISVKTAPTEVPVHETDYSQIKEKIQRVNVLKETTTVPDGNEIRVESPIPARDGKRRLVGFKTLLKEATDLTLLKKFIVDTAEGSLDKDYVDAAAISMSLDLQEAIYNYIDAVENGTDLPQLGFERSARRSVKFFREMQGNRKAQAIRNLASVIDPESNIHRRPDLFDAEEQAEDLVLHASATSIPPISESKLKAFLDVQFANIAAALDADENLKRAVKDLLNKKVHKGRKITKRYNSMDTAVELVHYLASKAGSDQTAAELELRLRVGTLEAPAFKLGKEVKEALTLLGVTSPALTRRMENDPELYALIEMQLQELSGSTQSLTFGDVKTFYTQLRKGAALYKKRALKDGKSMDQNAKENREQLEGLGLVDGDPESVIAALENILKKGPKQLRILAKLLLNNKDYIRSIDFVIDESHMNFAGGQLINIFGDHSVIINIARSHARGVQDTLVHEYIHAFTRDILTKPAEARTESQNEAVRTLELLMDIAKTEAVKQDRGEFSEATSDVVEFLAYFLTDPEFQKFVTSIVPESEGDFNLFQWIIKTVSKLLGKENQPTFEDAMEGALSLLNRTGVPNPVSKSGYTGQVARSINQSQKELFEISESLGMKERAEIDEKLQQRAAEVVEFAASYIPRELNITIDTESDALAELDSETGMIALNPKRIAAKLATMGANDTDPQRRKHILAVILNKAMGEAAADAMTTDQQYAAVTSAMTETEFVREVLETYPVDEQEAIFAILRGEGGPEAQAAEQFKLTKKAMARHAEMATRGMSSAEQIAFLQLNPNLLTTFAQYLKAYLSKMFYHRSMKDVSPEMRKAVNNMVIEIRAMELGYRPAPSVMTHNPRNPYAVVEQLMQQAVNTNRFVPEESMLDFPDDPENGFYKGYAYGTESPDLESAENSNSSRNRGLGLGLYFTKSQMTSSGRVEGVKYEVPTDRTTSEGNTPEYVYTADIRLQNPLVVDSLFGGAKSTELNTMLLKGIADRYGLTPKEYTAFKAAMDQDGFSDQNFIKLPNELISSIRNLDKNASYYGKITQFIEIVNKFSEADPNKPATGADPTDSMLRLFSEITGYDGVYSRREQMLAVWDKSAVTLKSRTRSQGGSMQTERIASEPPIVLRKADDNELFDLGFRDDLRVGTAKLGTDAVPKETPQNSNIGGVLAEGNDDPKALEYLRTKTIPKQIAQITKALKASSPNGRYIVPKEFTRARNPEKKLQILKDFLADNLVALHNAVDPAIRERSKRWYQGANRIANGLADKYNVTTQQVAGVMATLSPQKDWFLNLAQAEQTLEVFSNYQEYVMGNEEFSKVVEEAVALAKATDTNKKGKTKAQKDKLDEEARNQRAEMIAPLSGKSLAEIIEEGNPDLMGWAIRLISETEFGKGVTNVTPEGEPNGPYMKDDGSPVLNGWGSAGESFRAVSILLDGSAKNISERLGKYHKVRNFYNNIATPFSNEGDVTIDTHAVAAAFLMPYAQKAVPVSHNFGGASSTEKFGMQGTYHIYADAYRQAANTLGIPPYQLQSITWEAIREIYPANSRKNLKYVAERETIFKENDPEAARNEILGRAIPKPLWFGTPDSGLLDRAETLIGSEVQKEAIARRGLLFSGRRSPDGGGVTELGVPPIPIEAPVVNRKTSDDEDIQSQFGQDSRLPESLDPVLMAEQEIGNWLELLDVPLFELGEYEFENKGAIKKFLYKTFVRRADKRVVEFHDINQGFTREARVIVSKFQEEADRVIAEEDKRLSKVTGREEGNIPAILVSRASGATEGTQLTDEQQDLVQDEYQEDVRAARRTKKLEDETGVQYTERVSGLYELAKAKKQERITELREQNRAEQLADRDKALSDLLTLSPKMYGVVLKLRQIQDQLSKKAVEVFGPSMDSTDLNLFFDFNRGIYMTRRYRMFEDVTFAKDVKESDEYADVREQAITYFAKKLSEEHIDEKMEETGMSYRQARQALEEEAVAKDSRFRSDATVMVGEFIDAYSKADTKKRFQIQQREAGQQEVILKDAGFPPNSPLQKIVNDINDKQNIPEPIRQLLGEYGQEEGISNLAYTLSHTASMVSNQAFFNKLKRLGTKNKDKDGKDAPWMVTAAVRDANPQDYPNWVQIEAEGNADVNPVNGMYVPKEVESNLRDLFGNKKDDPLDPFNQRAQVAGYVKDAARWATGMTLALRTLGGIGFYMRNVLGNGLFFGPMQGYYGGIPLMFKEGTGTFFQGGQAAVNKVFGTEYNAEFGKDSLIVKAFKGSREDIDFALVELKSRNVFGDELEVTDIQDLLTGNTKYSDLMKKLKQTGLASNWLQSIKQKTGSVKVPDQYIPLFKEIGIPLGKAGMLPIKGLKKAHDLMLKTGGRVASAADGYFKVGLYNFELETLIDAAKHDIENGNPQGRYGRLLDKNGEPTTAMKNKAADIVKDTAQAYSRAVPAIKQLTRNSISLALAPYVRFAADIPRVYANGVIRTAQEIKDPNPVIRRRGFRRAAGAITTTTISVGLTKGSQMLLFGLDDEEADKAIRSMIPVWMRDSGILFYKTDDGLYSIDLQYLNPFAIVQDPVVRSIEAIVRGKRIDKAILNDLIGLGGEDGIGKKGLIKPYFQEQILAGAVLDAIFKDQDQYDNELILKGESNVLLKKASYIYDRAFEPNTVKALDDSFDAFMSKDRSDDFFKRPIGRLLKEVLPIKPYKVDVNNGYRRFIRNHMEEYNANKSRFAMKMLSPNEMTYGDIQRAYDDFAHVQVYQNNEFYQILKGFRQLGLTPKQIRDDAKSRGVSLERLDQNKGGFMNRPFPTLPLQDKMKKTTDGKRRLNTLKKVINDKYPRKKLTIDP
tara:strand:- start:4307 stop:16507 length:12201 start_codon:yes stop_codon:yes gene_type:complete